MPTDKAAWAYVILHDGHAMTATGGKVGATNNQMEMTAVLESLKALEDMGLSQKKLLLSLDLLRFKLKFAWLRSTVSDAGSDFVDSLLIKRMDE